jgi:hypothetical protein
MGSLFRVFQARGGRFDLALLVTIAVVAGCTTGFEDPAFQQAQSAKLSSEVQAVSSTNTGRGRLFYIGLALFSQKWSENDVVDLATVLRRVSDYDVVSLIASNASPSLPETYPIADDCAIEALVRTAADAAKDSDLIFVYISTHGPRGALTRKVGVFPEQSLSANGLAELLQPLVGHRTVIFLSACYSGSLLDQLKSEDRIVVTAARLDRPSFGCKPAAQHTYFGEAVLRSFGHRERSLKQIVPDIMVDVAAQERANRNMASEPQVFVGQRMTRFYTEPVF